MPMVASSHGPVSRVQDLNEHYCSTRNASKSLCEPLETEDYGVQSMPDASPVKWHLAHTSWFFATFVLAPSGSEDIRGAYQYDYLFNSYYNSIGQRIARGQRGVISRPTVAEVFRYREAVDDRMRKLLESADEARL